MVAKLKVDQLETVDGTGIITANNPLAGDGSSLTSLPAANVTGTHTSFTSTGIDDNATSNAITISADEEVTMPSQPCFMARGSATNNNVTGNNTVWSVDFPTEIFDQGSNFASDTFTASVTGKYLLLANLSFLGVSSPTGSRVTISTSNRDYYYDGSGDSYNAVSTVASYHFAVIADMDSGDTASVKGVGYGDGADIWDSHINGTGTTTHFAGVLLA